MWTRMFEGNGLKIVFLKLPKLAGFLSFRIKNGEFDSSTLSHATHGYAGVIMQDMS